MQLHVSQWEGSLWCTHQATDEVRPVEVRPCNESAYCLLFQERDRERWRQRDRRGRWQQVGLELICLELTGLTTFVNMYQVQVSLWWFCKVGTLLWCSLGPCMLGTLFLLESDNDVDLSGYQRRMMMMRMMSKNSMVPQGMRNKRCNKCHVVILMLTNTYQVTWTWNDGEEKRKVRTYLFESDCFVWSNLFILICIRPRKPVPAK